MGCKEDIMENWEKLGKFAINMAFYPHG